MGVSDVLAQIPAVELLLKNGVDAKVKTQDDMTVLGMITSDAIHNYTLPVSSVRCFIFISARQHAERAICYRKSVCLSVCPSVTRVDQSKTVEARIVQ